MSGAVEKGHRRLEREEEREAPLRTGGQAPAFVVALDEEVHRPANEIELVEELEPEAGVGERGQDLAERMIPAVLDEPSVGASRPAYEPLTSKRSGSGCDQ
jgi:hypothetical protein